MAPGESNIIKEKLDEFIRKYYKNQLIKGLIYSSALLLLFYVTLSTLEYFAEFGTAVRTALFYLYVASGMYILGRFIIIPLLKLNSLGNIITYRQASAIIGQHFSNVQDKLLNVLQLQELSANTASVELLQAGIYQKTKELKPVPFTAAINLSENKKYLKYLAVPIFIIFCILIISPKVLSTGTNRLIHHGTYFEKEAPFSFEIENKNLRAIQQQDFTIHVKTEGNQVPAEAYLLINGIEYKLDKEDNTHFNYVLKNLQKDVSFQLSGGGFTSKPFTLQVLPKPVLLGFKAQVKYPVYLHRKPETITNSGDITVPQGSEITWMFSTKNTNEIRFVLPDSTVSLTPQAADKFSVKRYFMRSTSYSIYTSNQFISKADSVNYLVNVIPDAYPLIETSPQVDSSNRNIIYFSGNIKDDYGFTRFLFKYKLYTSDSMGTSREKESEYVMPLQKDQLAQAFAHYLDLSKIEMNPGDKLEYYFEVWDNDGVNGAKSAKSSIMTFKAPTIEELEKESDKNKSELKDELEQSLKKAQELQKDIADLNKKVLEKKQLGWEEKKQMEKLLNQQKELEKKLDQLKQDNAQNNQEENKYKQPDENILEKQRELEKLFENLMTPEMKKMFDDLQKLMDKMDKNKVQETLEQLKMSDKDIEKELDRTLEQFKQMEIEEKMEKAVDKLNELAKKQEDLSKQTENSKQNQKKENDKNQSSENNNSKEQLEQKQNELTQKFDEIKKDIQQAQELNQSLENKLPLPDTKQQEQSISKEQQNASEQLQKNNQKNASQSQKQAAQQMQEMSSQMKQALEKMQQEQEGEDMQALRQIMENLMRVSFSQEDLVKDIKKTRINDPRYTNLAQTQKQLQDDSRMIEDSLLALSKRNPKVSANINREVSSIQMNMQKTLSALEERNNGEAQVRGQSAMTSINNLALMLNESLERMQKQMQQQKNGSPGSGSCKKPGQGNGQKPSMSNMRKMQEQLNKQIEQMKKMLEQQGKEQGGKKPGEKPGHQKNGTNPYGNIPGSSESLVKMAAEQEAIRRAVQEALQKMKKDGQNPGGDLLNKMEETETDLVNKQITQETIRRQQEILTKLLESEKAEREQEQDEKRKSNEAENQDYTNPALFKEYQKLKEKETELLKTMPADLTPYYRQKVNQYFNSVVK